MVHQGVPGWVGPEVEADVLNDVKILLDDLINYFTVFFVVDETF